MKVDREVRGGDHTDFDTEDGKREYTWSVNLELDKHGDDRERVVEEAMEAVEQTAEGYFVNLVTHQNHGHPSEYLYERLHDEFDDIDVEYVAQCGCGGYVSRVHRIA
ncbi:MAG: CGCGG family rSAM-modified RiPP protein [Halobacteria archaeon]|nr:CGCGG family rSAM-modified RiPP protein [Halobacteria archaeon]